MFSPIAHSRFGATTGYTGSRGTGETGSRGTGEVRPRGKPCCYRLQSAEIGHSVHCDQTGGSALTAVIGLSSG